MTQPNRRAVGAGLGAMLALGAAPAARAAGPDAGAVVAAIAKVLREQYIDAAAGGRLADQLLANLKAGRYRTGSSVRLAELLTGDLRAATHDLHMNVVYEPKTVTPETAETLPEDDLHPRTTGWGVQTVARLQGDIGLLRVTHFPSPPSRFDQRYAAAMELLQDTSALVLDLTVNHGGGTDTYGLFMSYFLDGDIEFGRMQWRNDPVEIVHTWPEAPGRRYGETRPMFVAISSNTFSAGEAVAAELKARKRAVLVGQRTKGGAHAGNFVDLPGDFRIFVVMGRSQGPDTDGQGVLPDVPAAAADAVRVAHRLAIEAVLAEAEPKQAQILRNVLANRIENLSSFPAFSA